MEIAGKLFVSNSGDNEKRNQDYKNLVSKNLVIGNSDFKSTIEQNGLIVDKSLFIKEIIDDKAQVKLIIRPRRFGKTFNMSMLKYFFDIQEKQGHLFHELKIWQVGERYRNEQGKYPVLFISFKDIKGNNFQEAYEKFELLLSKLYKQYKKVLFEKILEDDEDEKKAYQNIIDCKAKKSSIEEALKNLTEYLCKIYDKRVIVLIDEYDTPINEGYVHNYYKEMADFVRMILSPMLKDNTVLHQAVLTGIFFQLVKDSEYYELTNLTVYTILDQKYSSCFGFLLEEIKFLLSVHNIDSALVFQLEEWYGGYQIGNRQIYNPWSIVNFIAKNQNSKNLRFDNYWVDTAKNQLITKLLNKITENTEIENMKIQNIRMSFRKLIANKSIKQMINEHIIFSDIDGNLEAFWSFLLLQGYLTFKANSLELNGEKSQYELTIPNKELYKFYKEIVKLWLKEENLILEFEYSSKKQGALNLSTNLSVKATVFLPQYQKSLTASTNKSEDDNQLEIDKMDTVFFYNTH